MTDPVAPWSLHEPWPQNERAPVDRPDYRPEDPLTDEYATQGATTVPGLVPSVALVSSEWTDMACALPLTLSLTHLVGGVTVGWVPGATPGHPHWRCSGADLPDATADWAITAAVSLRPMTEPGIEFVPRSHRLVPTIRHSRRLPPPEMGSLLAEAFHGRSWAVEWLGAAGDVLFLHPRTVWRLTVPDSVAVFTYCGLTRRPDLAPPTYISDHDGVSGWVFGDRPPAKLRP